MNSANRPCEPRPAVGRGLSPTRSAGRCILGPNKHASLALYETLEPHLGKLMEPRGSASLETTKTASVLTSSPKAS